LSLILVKLQGFHFLVFRKVLRAAGNRRGSFTRSILLSGQLQSFSPNNSRRRCWLLQLVGMGSCIFWLLLAIGTEEQLPQKLWLELLLCLSYTNFFYLTCTSTVSLSDQFYQVSNAYRLWPMNSVQLRNVLIVPTLFNRKLEEYEYFAPVWILNKKSVEISVRFTEFSSCHDEIIIVSLPGDLSAKSKARTI